MSQSGLLSLPSSWLDLDLLRIVGESALGSALSLSESDGNLGIDSKRLMSAATRPAVRMVGR